jgi:hypothetical protein
VVQFTILGLLGVSSNLSFAPIGPSSTDQRADGSVHWIVVVPLEGEEITYGFYSRGMNRRGQGLPFFIL